jgi:predicted NAD/FAD-binding protein
LPVLPPLSTSSDIVMSIFMKRPRNWEDGYVHFSRRILTFGSITVRTYCWGAYENTRWLLTQLNSERQLSPIPFAVHFHHASNDIRSVISNASLPGPLHLLPGLLKKGFFSPLQILRLGFALKRSARYLHPIPALDWLQSLGFNKTQLERFWSPLIRSVMNNDMDRVPADLLHIVLNQGF